jgi:hypothetical protein
VAAFLALARSFRKGSLPSGAPGLCRRNLLGYYGFAPGRMFACFNGRAVAADMSDQFIPEMGLDEGFMHPLAQPRLRKLVKGAREGGLGRQLLAQRETADAAQRTVYRQALDSPTVVFSPNTALATKAFASHARSIGGRPTPHQLDPVYSSMRTHSRMCTTFSSFGVSGPSALNSGSSSC